MEEDPIISFNKLYISSSDTLCGLPVDQSVKIGWNDRPPLFHDAAETDDLLKGVSACFRGDSVLWHALFPRAEVRFETESGQRTNQDFHILSF